MTGTYHCVGCSIELCPQCQDRALYSVDNHALLPTLRKHITQDYAALQPSRRALRRCHLHEVALDRLCRRLSGWLLLSHSCHCSHYSTGGRYVLVSCSDHISPYVTDSSAALPGLDCQYVDCVAQTGRRNLTAGDGLSPPLSPLLGGLVWWRGGGGLRQCSECALGRGPFIHIIGRV